MKAREVESLEDMVFRNRNKDYGAYSIRRSYSRSVLISLIAAIVLLLSAIAYPLISGYRNKGMNVRETRDVEASYMATPPPENIPPPPPPPPPPEQLMEKVKFTVPKVVNADSVTDQDFGKQDLLAMNTQKELPPPEENLKPLEEPKKEVIETQAKPEPLTFVEEMPTFPGGVDAMYKYLNDNIKYPEEAKEANISGTVYIAFVVETDGSITDIKVVRGIGPLCDQEALRVVKAMPNWVPGKQNGKAVRVRFSLPIKFVLQ